MKTLDGWQRLGIFLTIVWVSGVVLFSVYEYQAVSSGASPTEFVVLRDTKTQKEFGGLSVGEVKRLGELTLKKSRSAESEPGDAEEAKFLLEAEPEPVLRYSKLAIWIALPVVCFLAIFVGVRWVAAGFRRSDLGQPSGMGDRPTMKVNAPDVPLRKVVPELAALTVALMLPLLFLAIDLREGKPEWFQRSGVISIVLAAIVEYKFLALVMNKNIVNAIRARDGQEIQGVSPARHFVSYTALVIAALGTVVTGYGDKLVCLLQSWW